MSFRLNPLSTVDSYKLGHRGMFPPGVTEVYSNFTPRSVNHLNVPEKYKTNEIIWFGGQAIIKDLVELWDKEFFSLSSQERAYGNEVYPSVLDDVLLDFQKRVAPFAGPNYSIEHLRALHKLGYLPLEIKTLPEGSRVPVGVPVLTIRNTHPEFFWLTNYLETVLSTELWKMSTSATIAGYYKKILNYWSDKTGSNKDFINFQAHDFSMRGMSGALDAAKSGAGHLTSFTGSDTVPAVDYLAYHYSAKNTFVAASVPASEHSIQCCWEQDDLAYVSSMIEKYPTGIVSAVCDGYDYWNVLTDVLPQLKDKIMARQPDSMGFSKFVVRPDSGDPVRIIAGYSEDETYLARNEDDLLEYRELGLCKVLSNEEVKGSIQVLWDLFGGTINDKGYKTLDPHIGLIYGDSITLGRTEEILSRLAEKGFSADNVVFGVGSYTYQGQTRDSCGFAMKATNITRNGVDIPLFKFPKTDNGTKKSAKGLLSVSMNTFNNSFELFDNVSREVEGVGALTTLFKDGKFLKHETLVEIRERVKS